MDNRVVAGVVIFLLLIIVFWGWGGVQIHPAAPFLSVSCSQDSDCKLDYTNCGCEIVGTLFVETKYPICVSNSCTAKGIVPKCVNNTCVKYSVFNDSVSPEDCITYFGEDLYGGGWGGRNSCYYSIARRLKDPSICEPINVEDMKMGCIESSQ